MTALHELISQYGVDVGSHLDRDADVPVLTGPQVQGDVAIRPVRRLRVRGRRVHGRWVRGDGIRIRWIRARWVDHRPVRGRKSAVTPIPAAGIVVSAGREGHEHRLLPGPARFDPVILHSGASQYKGVISVTSESRLIGILTVPKGCEQYLAHDQHGYLGIGPGTYEIGGQREWTAPSPRVRSGWRQLLD